MTVRELREALERMPPDAPVLVDAVDLPAGYELVGGVRDVTVRDHGQPQTWRTGRYTLDGCAELVGVVLVPDGGTVS